MKRCKNRNRDGLQHNPTERSEEGIEITYNISTPTESRQTSNFSLSRPGKDQNGERIFEELNYYVQVPGVYY